MRNESIIKLPKLPLCRVLYCYDNKIKKLLELPLCENLACLGNELKILPSLSRCKKLYCRNNLLKSLPQLPNCVKLYCDDLILDWVPKILIINDRRDYINNIKEHQKLIIKSLEILHKEFKDKNSLLFYTHKDIIYSISLFLSIKYQL